MSNSASYSYLGGGIYYLKVNGETITTGEYDYISTAVSRLNNIFNDSNRDLDFITPSMENGKYVICCPKVRKNVGEITYLYDTNSSDGWRSYPAKLYEPTNWSNTSNVNQTAIMEVSGVNAWYQALTIANSIRDAISLNFNDAANRSSCQKLYVPSNTSSSVSMVISNSARCDFYGVPCQGTEPGQYSSCPELGYSAQNILNTTTAHSTEVFHPQDLTAAITSSDSWYSKYKGKFVKVTNLSNNKSVVVRITDAAPANKGIELAYRPWSEIGKPQGSNSVKIELMG